MIFIILLLDVLRYIFAAGCTTNCAITKTELQAFSSIYGATVLGTGTTPSAKYPNYQERYIHHHWNIVRFHCEQYVDQGYSNFGNTIKTTVCGDSTIDPWPTAPVHYHPRLVEAARYHSSDLLNNCPSRQLSHDSCDNTGAGTRVNTFVNPGCYMSGEILWGNGIGYQRAVDGWMCECSSPTCCTIGGHTRAIFEKNYKVAGAGADGFINGDWSSCDLWDPNLLPIHSGLWITKGGESQFAAMFYGPDLTNVNGYVRIEGTQYALTEDISGTLQGTGHYSTSISGIATDCTQKFQFEFTAKDASSNDVSFKYPVAGQLFVGYMCPTDYYVVPVCDSPVCSAHGVCTGINECTCDANWGSSTNGCVDPICSPTCSSHGTCTDGSPSAHYCSCDGGYGGSDCSDTYCWGIPDTDALVCGGSVAGSCTGPNTCSCTAEYTGTECEFKIVPDIECFTIASDNPLVCSGHGACTEADVCTCSTGWTTSDCSDKVTCDGIDWDDQTVCSSLGDCTGIDICTCDDDTMDPETFCFTRVSTNNQLDTGMVIGITVGSITGILLFIILTCVVIFTVFLVICKTKQKMNKYQDFNDSDTSNDENASSDKELEDEVVPTPTRESFNRPTPTPKQVPMLPMGNRKPRFGNNNSGYSRMNQMNNNRPLPKKKTPVQKYGGYSKPQPRNVKPQINPYNRPSFQSVQKKSAPPPLPNKGKSMNWNRGGRRGGFNNRGRGRGRSRNVRNQPPPPNRNRGAPKRENGRVGKAVQEYVASRNDELSFFEGDRVQVLREDKDGWAYGYVIPNSKHRGMFPLNFLQM